MATLRIHFTPEDLARIRFAPRVSACWETAFSLNLLQQPESIWALAVWRSWAGQRLGTWVDPLLASAPPAERFPDFIQQLQADDGARSARLLERYHRTVLDPNWSTISTSLRMDQARRTRQLLENGVEGLLDTLAPMFRWQSTFLETEHPVDHDLWLGGRGLILLPTYFCSRQPVILTNAARPTVLVHPIIAETRLTIATERPSTRRRPKMDAVIGSTRAAVLQTLGSTGYTTKELANRVGISTSSASEHATVLREAGLISTHRHGPSVRHVVTALGSSMLERPGTRRPLSAQAEIHQCLQSRC
jgi:DNA-binding transcriptional ArsR family regulator